MRLARCFVALTVAALLGGCLDATNPCDPAADDALRARSALSGIVKDQRGAPLTGVTVSIPGHATPAISGEDGGFRFEGLVPNAGPQGYEVVALAEEPAVGGRTVAPPVGCEAEVTGVELVVAIPPASPEVEFVYATAPDRLFVAFAAAEGGARYSVEVRAPFETWQPALLASAPMVESRPAAASERLTRYDSYRAPALDDSDARGFCDAFRYALSPLAHENARCAEVIGVSDGEQLRLLDEHGSYEVRVRAELSLDEALVGGQRLPQLVRSAPTAVPGELSLVPTSVLPVMLAPDPAAHEEQRLTLDVQAMVPVAHGRFAMLGEGLGSEGLLIVGAAESTAPGMYEGAESAPGDALAFDGTSSAASSEMRANSGEGVAILPAKRWARVWKRSLDPDTDLPRSEVEKVFIGAQHRGESHSEQPEPVFGFDLEERGLSSDLRAFAWLVQPEGTLGGEGPYDPVDGYLLLLRGGFVLLEHEAAGHALGGGAHLEAFVDGLLGGLADDMPYGESSANLPNAMGTGHCDDLGRGGLGVDGEVGERTVRVCLDLDGALGESLSLSDVTILRSHEGSTEAHETFHVMSDAAGDRVLVVPTSALLGHGGDPLVHHIVDVPTGVAPSALAPSRLLACEEGDGAPHEPVVLVANRGSLDVSLLGVVGARAGVEEVAVVPVPGVPVRFFEDPDGPSCADPFVWVVLDDGRSVPIDLRRARLGVPRCGDEACAVRTSDRAPIGAVSRDAEGRSRVLVGGRRLLGEVAYLRPSASAAKEPSPSGE